MKICITGDRSAFPPVVLPIVQQLLLKQLMNPATDPISVVSGLDRGVENAVRFVTESAGIETLAFDFATKEWDVYAQMLKSNGVEKVYFIHGDPGCSNLYPALSTAFTDEQFELVAPELLFAVPAE